MMVLPPIIPFLNAMEKGSVRRLSNFAAPHIGISSRQLNNISQGRNRPRISSIGKIIEFLNSNLNYTLCSLYSLRYLARLNEWVALISAADPDRLLHDKLPHLFDDIYYFGELDSKLERLYRKPDFFSMELAHIPILCLQKKLKYCNLNFHSRKKLRGSLAGFRFHTTVYLIACLEVELLTSTGKTNVKSTWSKMFFKSSNPRRIFLEALMKRAGILSKNELAERYSAVSISDIENRKRHIRRLANGKHSITRNDLKFLVDLLLLEREKALTHIEYYISRYVQIQADTLLNAEKIGLSDQLTQADFGACYEEYFYYCLRRKREHFSAPAS